jgi:hypothetical protein
MHAMNMLTDEYPDISGFGLRTLPFPPASPMDREILMRSHRPQKFNLCFKLYPQMQSQSKSRLIDGF